VFDPFLGIGSTPYVALQMGRRGIGCELKQSYYKQAVKNLEHIAGEEIEYGIVGQMDIFDFI
jgi:DNA modification methylase